jgi:imidazoleglycerol phosphate dehydratase HisB
MKPRNAVLQCLPLQRRGAQTQNFPIGMILGLSLAIFLIGKNKIQRYDILPTDPARANNMLSNSRRPSQAVSSNIP